MGVLGFTCCSECHRLLAEECDGSGEICCEGCDEFSLCEGCANCMPEDE